MALTKSNRVETPQVIECIATELSANRRYTSKLVLEDTAVCLSEDERREGGEIREEEEGEGKKSEKRARLTGRDGKLSRAGGEF